MKNFISLYRLYFLLLAVTTGSCFSAHAQNYLLHKKSNVERQLKKYTSQNKEKTFVYKTDSTLRLSVQDSLFRAMDLTYFFNDKGVCYRETKTTDCNECFQKYLNEVLSKKMYKWKKVNDTLYISGKFWNRCIVMDQQKPFSYSIIHAYMDKKKQKKLHESIH